MKITLLKLGGSLITDKAVAYKAEHAIIDVLAEQIQQARAKNPELNLVIGNGAGSFAHQSAKKYGTNDGFADDEGRLGACIVHMDAVKLNQIVIESLLKHSIPAFSLQPSAFITRKEKQLTGKFDVVTTFLEKKIIPIVYGDVLIDNAKGSTICSTDTIFKLLAKELKSKNHQITIIHAGKYPGVLGVSGRVIRNISPENLHEVLPALGEAEATDVTGGMKLKVQEMAELASLGITSHIIDGRAPKSVYNALQGSFDGTTIGPI